jgi:hypothetical protein
MEEKSFYDRANFFLTAQAIFANAFATLAISSNLNGLYKFLPITICLIGISLNIAWIYSSFFQEDVKTLVKKLNLKDVIYKAAPILLTLGWVALLIFFTLETFGIIKIPFLN